MWDRRLSPVLQSVGLEKRSGGPSLAHGSDQLNSTPLFLPAGTPCLPLAGSPLPSSKLRS